MKRGPRLFFVVLGLRGGSRQVLDGVVDARHGVGVFHEMSLSEVLKDLHTAYRCSTFCGRDGFGLFNGWILRGLLSSSAGWADTGEESVPNFFEWVA